MVLNFLYILFQFLVSFLPSFDHFRFGWIVRNRTLIKHILSLFFNWCVTRLVRT